MAPRVATPRRLPSQLQENDVGPTRFPSMKPNTLRANRVILATSLLVGICPCLQAEQPASADSPVVSGDASSPHTLFMGVELAVERDAILLPVRDVQGSSIIAKRKGKEVRIPTTGKSLNLKVTRSLKVAAQSATIEKLTVERAYTEARDPLKKFAAQAGAQAGADAVASLALGNYVAALVSQDFGAIAASRDQPVDTQAINTRVDNALTNYSQSLYTAGSQTLTAGEAASELAGDLAEEAYDALYIAFKVSSPKPLLGAYVVVLAQLRAGEETKATQYNWVYAKALGLVDANPQPVYIKQGGFPPGYVIERCEVHLFDQGEEIATNESPMQVQLSRDEAFQYAAIEYISHHKDATLPADLAGGQNTEPLRAHLATHYHGGPIYVSVSRDGLARGLFRDKAGESPLADDTLLEIVRAFRFNPALVSGKAVDSLVKVKATPEDA